MNFTAKQIATVLSGQLLGNPEAQVSDVAPIESAAESQLAYVTDQKYLPALQSSHAGVVLITASIVGEYLPKDNQAFILVENARGAMAQLLQMVAEVMNPRKRGIEQPSFIAEGVEIPEDAYVGAFAYIAKGAKIGAGAQIYPQAYVGENVKIGKNAKLYAGVKVYYNCIIGNDCILHAGCVIGADGFGFEPDAQGVNQKVPQIGNVIIEDDVEIGANTTIDRAMMGSTIVRRNAKIDNLVMVAHNVEVGQSTFMCGQSGVAGSTTIGSHCVLTGQVGICGHVQIADNCVFAAQTGVEGNITKPGIYGGSPAQPAMEWKRSVVRLRQMGKK